MPTSKAESKSCKFCNGDISEVEPAHIFCHRCGITEFSDEELEQTDRVWIIKSDEELLSYAMRAEDAPIHNYILIKEKIASKINRTLNSRKKKGGKYKRQAIKGAVSLAKAGASVGGAIALQKLGVQKGGISKLKGMESKISLAAATVSLGSDVAILSGDGEEGYSALPFALECDLIVSANFKIIRNASSIILRKEKTITQVISETNETLNEKAKKNFQKWFIKPDTDSK